MTGTVMMVKRNTITRRNVLNLIVIPARKKYPPVYAALSAIVHPLAFDSHSDVIHLSQTNIYGHIKVE